MNELRKKQPPNNKVTKERNEKNSHNEGIESQHNKETMVWVQIPLPQQSVMKPYLSLFVNVLLLLFG